jgi:AcrR family transcriptional regulator
MPKGHQAEDRPTSALRADARRNLRQIITAADELLKEEGVGISMNAIAARAGVGVGTLYRNFPNKGVLLEVMTRQTLEVIYSETEAIARSASPERAFVDASRFLVRALSSRAELFRAGRLERGSMSIGRSQLGAFC